MAVVEYTKVKTEKLVEQAPANMTMIEQRNHHQDPREHLLNEKTQHRRRPPGEAKPRQRVGRRASQKDPEQSCGPR